jgi:hypothetical protein
MYFFYIKLIIDIRYEDLFRFKFFLLLYLTFSQGKLFHFNNVLANDYINLCKSRNFHSDLKGAVAWDFPPLVFFHQLTPFGPLFHLLHFLLICFEYAALFEFEIRSSLWATAGNQIFFADTRNLRLECHMTWLLLFMYIHFISSQSL